MYKVNLIINDAGGLSVLTSWAAGKFSGTSISKYIQENIESKVKSRKLIIPGKVAVLKGDLEAKTSWMGDYRSSSGRAGTAC